MVELCGTAEANLVYCHSKLVKLEPKCSVLLIGEVCLVKGHFNNYFCDSVSLEPGTKVKLYSLTFDIRISSNRHSIFIRTEDIVKERIKLTSIQEDKVKSSGAEDQEEDTEDSETATDSEKDHQSYDTAESSFEEEDNSNDGSRSGTSRIPSSFRVPMVDASTQTDDLHHTDFDTLLAEARDLEM